MADDKGSSFWTTLPGILSGMAALVTAGVAAYALLHGGTPSARAPASQAIETTLPDGPAAAKSADEPAGAIATRLNGDPAFKESLGAATGPEVDAPGGGRARDFTNGSIYWHPSTAAFTVHGAIRDKYRDLGGPSFGYPTTDELTPPDGAGRFNHFLFVYPNGLREDRSIYWRPDLGPHAIQGLIRLKWAQSGWEVGPLGYPTSDEYQAGVIRRQDFEHGLIDWSMASGAQMTLSSAAAPH
ncbi:hypothetical protein KZX46_18960 [Polymorphobacter sp. PAMC 29334]|uniref:LGFP repeat-containing protein n=1 Tax=Polymorphobacter sp. PAMC 29334 TaxID=2862331 RepID=UPI001C77CC38|nr:hypothetical protein [Polymorphobacter sp. PAMC 29334]QYE34794.1 hypothetical protein KZX46_18960 [Polymorphobacter sp. PAMC 29334]